MTLWRICVQKRSLFHQEDQLICRISYSRDNKKAFQWDAYRPLANHRCFGGSHYVLVAEGVGIPDSMSKGTHPPSPWNTHPPWTYPPPLPGDRMTAACENITCQRKWTATKMTLLLYAPGYKERFSFGEPWKFWRIMKLSIDILSSGGSKAGQFSAIFLPNNSDCDCPLILIVLIWTRPSTQYALGVELGCSQLGEDQ